MTVPPRSVAVVVVAPHGLAGMPATLASVAAQTVAAAEVLLAVPDADRAAAEEAGKRCLGTLPWRAISTPRGMAGALAVAAGAAGTSQVAPVCVPDTWKPRRLDATTALAGGTGARAVLCRSAAWHVAGDVSPRRLPAVGEPLDAYLLARRTVREDASVLSPSSLLVARELLLAVPAQESPLRHVVADWLLRAAAEEGLVPVWHPEPLVVTRYDRRRGAASEPWETTLRWVEEVRPLVSRRTYAGAVLGEVAAQARAAGDVRALRDLPRLARRRGDPQLGDLLSYASLLALPGGRRGGPPLLRQLLHQERRAV